MSVAESGAETEERFLAGLEQADMPVDDMLRMLAAVRAQGQAAKADGWAELLQDALEKPALVHQAVRLLEWRADWHRDDPAFRTACGKAVARLLGKGSTGEKMVDALGFNSALPVEKCLDRLKRLLRLEPGVMCYDRTWGFGVVRKVDLFYQELVVDFDQKQEHVLALAYALDALQLLTADHILAQRHQAPEKLADLVRTQPAEVVKLALRSYGEMNVQRLQEVLTGRIVAEADWKPFWEAARKALKTDPLVAVPAARKDPLRLLDRPKAYDQEWLAELARDRDLESIMSRLGDLETKAPDVQATPPFLRALSERLAYVICGVGDRQPGLLARAVMAAQRLPAEPGSVDLPGLTEKFMALPFFLAASRDLLVRDLDGFLQHLVAHDRARALRLLMEALGDMHLTLLNETLELLLREGEEALCADHLRRLFGARKESVEMLFWAARRLDRVVAWRLCRLADLPGHVLDALQGNWAGERLRAANQLRDLFEQRTWLEKTVGDMDGLQRREFMDRLQAAATRTTVDSLSVMARLIRLFPELGQALATEPAEGAAAHVRGGVTSWRTYRARQRQLERVVNEEIPQNSKDIAQARSYGDLSENHEYKAAKEHQSILMRRQADLETDLKTVQATDFAAFPKDVAGIGTSVSVRYPDARVERFTILGEWDQDQELGIIACGSRMAQLLDGHRPGDEVLLPSADGDVHCTLLEVGDVGSAVKTWVQGA